MKGRTRAEPSTLSFVSSSINALAKCMRTHGPSKFRRVCGGTGAELGVSPPLPRVLNFLGGEKPSISTLRTLQDNPVANFGAIQTLQL